MKDEQEQNELIDVVDVTGREQMGGRYHQQSGIPLWYYLPPSSKPCSVCLYSLNRSSLHLELSDAESRFSLLFKAPCRSQATHGSSRFNLSIYILPFRTFPPIQSL